MTAQDTVGGVKAVVKVGSGSRFIVAWDDPIAYYYHTIDIYRAVSNEQKKKETANMLTFLFPDTIYVCEGGGGLLRMIDTTCYARACDRNGPMAASTQACLFLAVINHTKQRKKTRIAQSIDPQR